MRLSRIGVSLVVLASAQKAATYPHIRMLVAQQCDEGSSVRQSHQAHLMPPLMSKSPAGIGPCFIVGLARPFRYDHPASEQSSLSATASPSSLQLIAVYCL